MLLGVVLLGLTLSGVTYAHWYKIIKVYGEVETGWLHLTPRIIMTPGPIEYQRLGKPVAIISDVDSCYLDNQVGFRIENVYPCLDVGWFQFGVVNDGTIPAGLEDLRITGTYQHEYDASPIDITNEVSFSVPYLDDEVAGGPAMAIDLFWEGPYGPDNEEYYGDCDDKHMATVWWKENYGMWVDPMISQEHGILQVDTSVQVNGEVWYDINMHFYECLPQRVEFTFMVEMEYWNWNEAYPYWAP